MPDAPFNPLEKQHLAESVADALLEREICPLPPPEMFWITQGEDLSVTLRCADTFRA